ncbi:MAG TPA: ornithine carbamoyltransferase [Burkholderiales bacterium]|nr:ornithine carbamoyltransferase [Burkholderiales bacterium]
MSPLKHYLQLKDLTRAEYEYLFERARVLKARRARGDRVQPLHGRVLAMLFEKNSTRTRVSFQAGMEQMGGSVVFLNAGETQLHRGEEIEDMAQVISRMVDAVLIRTYEHELVERFAAHSRVPVINGLTDQHHPCQIMADVFTYTEHRGPIHGRTVAWVGDGNNVCNTWLQAAQTFDFVFHVASPPGYELKISNANSSHLKQFSDLREAVRGADLVTTDVWVSMGDEHQAEERKRKFAAFRVDAEAMKLAKREALFMHCLPAHRGEEVDAEVIDGPQSVVWDEAENRLHTQKALLEYLFLGKINHAK